MSPSIEPWATNRKLPEFPLTVAELIRISPAAKVSILPESFKASIGFLDETPDEFRSLTTMDAGLAPPRNPNASGAATVNALAVAAVASQEKPSENFNFCAVLT